MHTLNFQNLLTLITPDISYKEEWKKIMDEWVDSEKRPTIFFKDSYEEVLERFSSLSLSDDTENTTPKSSFYFLIDTDIQKILGFYWFRHHLNFKNHSQVAGHIGYGIRPSERKKGYARKGLKLVLDEAEKLGYEKIYITCDATNIASEKVIRANGGIFEKFIQNSNHPQEKRYWIPLTNRHVPELLISLEKELLTYDTRHNPKRLDELLADDFFECGKTGSQFGKKECLEELPKESKDKKIMIRDISVNMLSEYLGQIFYTCISQDPGEAEAQSFRTSLWRKTNIGWQMFYHQGTLIQNN